VTCVPSGVVDGLHPWPYRRSDHLSEVLGGSEKAGRSLGHAFGGRSVHYLPMGIDHIGLGVPDVDAAKAYYDGFMPLVGFVREWESGYRATDWHGAQIFLYPTLEDGEYSRHRIGLQHISFYVPTRADVHRVFDWAEARDHEIVHEPKLFPEYHERFYATFFLDMHGFMLEAVTYENVDIEA
jgi:catechol 2,3-dioxygenase-like lactoylglutathione lyase family enzyme